MRRAEGKTLCASGIESELGGRRGVHSALKYFVSI